MSLSRGGNGARGGGKEAGGEDKVYGMRRKGRNNSKEEGSR